MPTIDLGKVKGEDGKDGVGGGSASIELLEKPMLESEVYQAQEGSSSDFVTYPKWNIPIQINKIKSAPKVGDVITIVLEAPYAGSRGGITSFKIDFKCINTETMVFGDIPIPITQCNFRVCAIAEPNVSIGNTPNGSGYDGVNFSGYDFNGIVLLGGVDDFSYLHGLVDLLNYADEHCGGIIEGLGTTAELRAEIGDGNLLEMIAFYSGGDVLPWWRYSTSSSTDTSGNISCLYFLDPQYVTTGSLPTSFEDFNIRVASNSGSWNGLYTGQYIIKSVTYKEM